jgi:hemerythrin-like domain-containing protein
MNQLAASSGETETARGHVKAVREALDAGDRETITAPLKAYSELLTEHIKKEDEVLYPWMDKNLTLTQVGAVFSRFSEVDSQRGDVSDKYEALIHQLEQKYHHEEE